MHRPRRALGALSLAILLASCAASGGEDDGAPSPPDPAAAARATADLGWAAITAGGEANRVVSPASFATTLGMLAEGATGETLTVIDDLFGLDPSNRAASLGALRTTLADYDTLPPSVDVNNPPAEPIVHQASHLAVVAGHDVHAEFTAAVADEFGAEISQIALADLKETLDAWVVRHTAGLIEQSAIDAAPGIALVVQDAVLFAAAWQEQFSSSGTFTFNSPAGEQEVTALRATLEIPHAQTEDWSAIRLPYDENLAMDVILPAAGVAPTDLQAEDLAQARAALDNAPVVKVSVTMPPLDVTATADLLEVLESLGLSFTGGLEGIYPGAEVGAFVQQAKLQVSAKGTVGAAVTEVAVVTSAPAFPEEIIDFTVDRPYALRVLDTRTGWPLFLATISDAEAAQS